MLRRALLAVTYFAVLGLPPVLADDACEKAFKVLKSLEARQQHMQKLDIDRLLSIDTTMGPCSKERDLFEYRHALRANEMAPVAREFIRACGHSSRHMADLELYSNDEALHPLSARRRQTCGVAEIRKSSSVR
jgi:hypothetical protein